MIRDIYIKGVAAGGGADTDIEVNGIAEGSVGVGSTLDIQITDGVDPITPDAVSLVGNELTIEVPAPKDLTLLLPYSEGDTSTEITIVTDSDGTINTADTTGLTSVVYEVNATVVTLPFTLAVADELVITFDSAGADGTIKLEGDYV